MRIIAGQYRGKKLFSPESDKVRPTSDRAREAVFNILNSMLDKSWTDYQLLDVFGGSGAFALEALSRGAKEVGLIDIDTRSLLKNTTLFNQEQNRIKVFRTDINKLPQAPTTYDIVFMDAPYNQGLSEIALKLLPQQGWLKDGALVITETEKTEQIALPSCYKTINERIYGLAKIIFLEYKAEN